MGRLRLAPTILFFKGPRTRSHRVYHIDPTGKLAGEHSNSNQKKGGGYHEQK
jgi:hypothetical protein